MHHLPEGQVGVLRMLNATLAYSKAGGVAGSAPGHSIQAGALAWAVSRLSPGWLLPGDHTGRGTLGATDVTEKGRAGLRAVSCLSSVPWVKDFVLG